MFNPDTDRITFTLYKTLYQAGEKIVIDYIDLYNCKNYYMFTPDNLYAIVLSVVFQLMRIMMKGDPEVYVSNNVIAGIDFEGYTGISAEITRLNKNDILCESLPDVLTIIYIPDVLKYGDLVCSGIPDGRYVSLCFDIRKSFHGYSEGYHIFGGNVISGRCVDISLGFNIDSIFTNIEYFDTNIDRIRSVVASVDVCRDWLTKNQSKMECQLRDISDAVNTNFGLKEVYMECVYFLPDTGGITPEDIAIAHGLPKYGYLQEMVIRV